MAISFASNLQSLKAERQLDVATQRVSSVYERLSSGLRINKASDDAAGLAIADSLGAKARVYTQGVRNINDGISLLSIAESAVQSLSTIVIRQKELAEQAANGTYSLQQRSALNAESSSLTKEYNRIVATTAFNGNKLIDGIDNKVCIQHGEGTQESTTVSVGDALGTHTGDGTFSAVISNSAGAGSSTYSVASGDFNGDGILDLVSVTPTAHTIGVSLGKGDGSFNSPTLYATAGNPLYVTTGDFDGDGSLDIATSDTTSNNLSVLVNKGDGTFQKVVSYTTAGPGEIHSADFNGDGIIDLAVTSSGSVGVWLGAGNGTFKSGVTYSGALVSIHDLTIGDFNNDGIADIACGSDYASLSILLGNGDGSFRARVAYATAGAAPNSIACGDVNGDGVLDLVTADASFSNVISILLGNRDGSFKAPSSAAAVGNLYQSVRLADLNNDGKFDIISVGANNSDLGVLLSNGDGTFKTAFTYSAAGSAHYGAEIGDFNGDGITDCVTADYTTGTFSVFTGAADASGKKLNGETPLDLTSIYGARQAIVKTTNLLQKISSELGNIGANQSRLKISASVLTNRADNYTAARSRILDADVASDAATLVQSQILQQAASSILAQANLQPNIGLKLLQGG